MGQEIQYMRSLEAAVESRLQAEKEWREWNCHDHRDELRVSYANTIYHPKHGQLCYVEKHWECILYHPIVFKDAAMAQHWIEEGCIADLQEGLHNLGVGFQLSCVSSHV